MDRGGGGDGGGTSGATIVWGAVSSGVYHDRAWPHDPEELHRDRECSMSNSYLYREGRLHAPGTFAISPEDRGLLYGDGLFETMRAYAGRVHLLGRHLARLRAGC